MMTTGSCLCALITYQVPVPKKPTYSDFAIAKIVNATQERLLLLV